MRYAITDLVQELAPWETRVAHDLGVGAIAPYHDAAASDVAQRLDAEGLTLLGEVTRMPPAGSA
jgi:hypothetical protein